MSPTVCQEAIGCASGCMEKDKGRTLYPKGCKDFSEYLDGCTTKAEKKSVEFKAARTPPKSL